MRNNLFILKLSKIYLTAIPFLAAILAFAIGHINYKIYLPAWLINSILMILAARVLSRQNADKLDDAKSRLITGGWFLIVPWIFISIFAGFGPPPSTIEGWVENATEQQIRYLILIMAGISITIGLILISEELKRKGEYLYSALGRITMTIAIPLFIINMTFWGSFLTASFKIFVASPLQKRPDWYLVMKEQFMIIGMTEVSLIYLATFAFAMSLKTSGFLSSRPCRIYAVVSLCGAVLNLIPPGSPDPFSTISYMVSIPAFPFIMPYLMGINLLANRDRNQ